MNIFLFWKPFLASQRVAFPENFQCSGPRFLDAAFQGRKVVPIKTIFLFHFITIKLCAIIKVSLANLEERNSDLFCDSGSCISVTGSNLSQNKGF